MVLEVEEDPVEVAVAGGVVDGVPVMEGVLVTTGVPVGGGVRVDDGVDALVKVDDKLVEGVIEAVTEEEGVFEGVARVEMEADGE